MLIAQISDCHVVEPGELVADRVDSAESLARAVDLLLGLDPLPDVVLATGDLVNDARPAQYDRLMELLAPLPMPIVAVMGNHDDRAQLRSRFGRFVPAGAPGDRVDFVVDDFVAGFGVRFVVLDTTVPGSHAGRIAPEQAAWLDAELGAAPDVPTIVVQHHPPFVSGIDFMDVFGLDGVAAEREAIARHPQVAAVVAGHLHRPIHTRFALTVASCCPSTAAAVALDIGGTTTRYSSEPPGLALHRFTPGSGLVTHLLPIVDVERWTPTWAV